MNSAPLPRTPGVPTDAAGAVVEAKRALRARLLAARRGRSGPDREAVAAGLAEVALGWSPIAAAGTVAAYVSVGSEPGTGVLLDALRAAGTHVLLPVLLGDNDLSWAPYQGPDSLVAAGRGLLEPGAKALGAGAISSADVVLVPGLGVSGTGQRLGRGGGSYDRALARVRAGVPVAVVLHEDEVGLAVPVERHDRTVTHALTPNAVIDLG